MPCLTHLIPVTALRYSRAFGAFLCLFAFAVEAVIGTQWLQTGTRSLGKKLAPRRFSNPGPKDADAFCLPIVNLGNPYNILTYYDLLQLPTLI